MIRQATSFRQLTVPIIALAFWPVADGADPPADDVVDRAAAVFEQLDAAPHDGVLAGPELEAVAGYDRDGDGRVTPEEFVRGYLEKKPVAAWKRHEFRRQGFACELPGTPEPLDAGGAARFQVAVELSQPPAMFIARMRDMPASATTPESFFDGVAAQIEGSGARIVGRRPADLGLHRGVMLAARREDGTTEIIRSVVAGRTVYELHAVLPPEDDEACRDMAARFLGSLQLVR